MYKIKIMRSSSERMFNHCHRFFFEGMEMMSLHYEIVFFKQTNICGENIIDWFASCEVFANRTDAICYAEQIKGDRQFRVFEVETDANGKPKAGYSGFELINKLYKELEPCRCTMAAERVAK